MNAPFSSCQIASRTSSKGTMMSGLPRNVLGGVGTVMLIHAGYSAFESLSYEKSLNPSANLSIPLDIRLETVVAVVFLCLAVVLNSAGPKSVRWSVWTNIQENERPDAMNFLEHRPGFLDIRTRRKEFLAKKGSQTLS